MLQCFNQSSCDGVTPVTGAENACVTEYLPSHSGRGWLAVTEAGGKPPSLLQFAYCIILHGAGLFHLYTVIPYYGGVIRRNTP